jgi:DNA-binding transcriptional ArsR family regulator
MIHPNLFAQHATDFLKALGNEKRQELLLNIFADGKPHNITEVAERAHIAQSTTSEHLSLLKRAGILVSQKVEKEVFYALDRKGILASLDEMKAILSCCTDE